MRFIVSIFILLTATVITTSCNQQTKVDYEKQRSMEYIDSLQSDLDVIRNMLDDVDLEEITHRKRYILEELSFVNENIKPEYRDAELEKVLTDYHGFAMMYDNLEKNIENIVKETEESFIQIKTLRQSVEDGDYGKEDFKTYLREEAKAISSLRTQAERYLGPVIESENMFMKRMEKLEEITKKLR